MNSLLVTVLLLASATDGSGGQGAMGRGGGEGVGGSVGLYSFPLTGVQVPITNYTCTEPDLPGFNDQEWCTVSGGLRTCAIAEGASLDGSITIGGTYVWNGSTNPFVILDIPQGWCVESVRMTFGNLSTIPALSLSVHSAEHLSTNTDRTMFSLVREEGTTVVMNLTTLARGKYLRINMTSTESFYLGEIEVFGTSRYTFTDTSDLHDMLTPLPTSLNLSSVTDDSICTHPSSAGDNPASPTTSVTPASPTTSVTPTSPTTSPTAMRKYTMLMCIVSIAVSTHLYRDTLYVCLTMHSLVTTGGGVFSCVCVASCM